MHQRLMFGMLVFAGVIALIAFRIIYLAAFGDHAGRKVGVTSLVPERGDIVDRDGQALARTIDAWTIALHPKKVIGDKLELARTLARLIPDYDEAAYFAMLRSDKPFFTPRPRSTDGSRQSRARRGALPSTASPTGCIQTTLAAHVWIQDTTAWHVGNRAAYAKTVRSGIARRADYLVYFKQVPQAWSMNF